MKMLVSIICILLLTATNTFSQRVESLQLTGPYFGQKVPGNIPKPFALDLLTGEENHYVRSITFTPDGKEAFWPIIDLQDGYKRWIVGSRIENGIWTSPRLASFSKKGFEDDVPCISPDGKKLFFLSQRSLDNGDYQEKENIWLINREGDNWSNPIPLKEKINSLENIHQQLTLDLKGNLYFSADVPGGYGAADIYRSEYVNGEYQVPVNLGPKINGQEGDYAPFISPDGSYLIYTKNTKDGWELFISFIDKDENWTTPSELSNYLEGMKGKKLGGAFVSRDGNYLIFFTREEEKRTPYWIDAKIIEEIKQKEL